MPENIKENKLPTWKTTFLGVATTVGELRKLIEQYPDETSFGFRNQPMQALYEVDTSCGQLNELYVVFDL